MTAPAELAAAVARGRAIAWLDKHCDYATAADVCISVGRDGNVSLQCSTFAGAERLARRLWLTERRDLDRWARWIGVLDGVAVGVSGQVPS